MNDHVFDILHNSSDDELIKIATNEYNEFNRDTVNFARQILEERKVDLTDIPLESTAGLEPRSDYAEIQKIKLKSVIRIFSGSILFFGGAVLFVLNLGYGRFSLFYLFLTLLGATNIYLYFKLKNKARTLTENNNNPQDSSTPEEPSLVKTLNAAIVLAKKGDTLKLEYFLADTVTQQNVDEVTVRYQAVYHKDFLDEIKNISNQFSTIKKVLQPLIDKGLVEPKYPHTRIYLSQDSNLKQ